MIFRKKGYDCGIHTEYFQAHHSDDCMAIMFRTNKNVFQTRASLYRHFSTLYLDGFMVRSAVMTHPTASYANGGKHCERAVEV